MSSTEALLDQAIAAAGAGNHRNALALLAQVVELDPRNERAWLWLAELVETDAQRIDCLERVLCINPDNSDARQRLDILKLKPPTAATPPYAPQPSPERPILPSPLPFVTGQSPTPSPEPPTRSHPTPAGAGWTACVKGTLTCCSTCGTMHLELGSRPSALAKCPPGRTWKTRSA